MVFQGKIMNHRPECINIWYESSFGRGDSTMFKWSP